MNVVKVIKVMMIAICMILNVFADETESNDEAMVGPCKSDVAKLCSGVTPGKGAIRECLKNNKDKVSEECKMKIKGKVADLREACAAEVKSFCSEIEKGKGRVIKCLKEKMNEASFGAQCKEMLGNMKNRKR